MMDPSEYENDFFRRAGFSRHVCRHCGDPFWSEKPREVCAESPCTPYSFQGQSPFSRAFDMDSFREFFLTFFEKRGHTRIRRYPVVPRWRNDVMFVQASIYDFQPWVTNGVMEPPANPLTISQPCLRFNDIENVGVTGRHNTIFEMMAHHAFNRPGHEIYFKARTIELCHELLTQELGVPGGEISYKEESWEGGGNLGPSMSVGLRGLEVATLVFMEYVRAGSQLRPMPLSVVDTGYGLERFVWMSQGTSTVYEAIFPAILKEIPSSFTPSEAAILADHGKSFAFLFTDGVVPSNVREGYLARLLLRRMLRILDRHPGELSLVRLLEVVTRSLEGPFPELRSNLSGLREVLELEEQRFREALERGRAQVRRLEERWQREKRAITVDDLVQLYDSLGVTPDVAQQELKVPLEIPPDFYSRVALRHERESRPAEGSYAIEEGGPGVPEPPSSTPATNVLYFQDPYTREFSAQVLWSEGPFVVLDRTYFYPTGGGQITDTGQLGDRKVVEVLRRGPWVIHRLDLPGEWAPGASVKGRIDGERRQQLMQHHTGTHLLNGALRRLLGPHIWQAGAYKGVEGARLDVTHYKNLSPQELSQVENLVNQVIREDRPVSSRWESRTEAEGKYGFTVYQGGAVPGKTLRIVDIEGFDVEACGGTHCTRTGEVGLLKVLSTERIQDGMLRLNFVAGARAYEVVTEHERMLSELSRELSVPVAQLLPTVRSLKERLRALEQQARQDSRQALRGEARTLLSSHRESHELAAGYRLVLARTGHTPGELKELARDLTRDPKVVAVLTGRANDGTTTIFVASGDPGRLSAREVLRAVLDAWPGKGGGNPSAATASGPEDPALEGALSRAIARARELAQRP
jgi:alanyl-tRNA synthetase